MLREAQRWRNGNPSERFLRGSACAGVCFLVWSDAPHQTARLVRPSFEPFHTRERPLRSRVLVARKHPFPVPVGHFPLGGSIRAERLFQVVPLPRRNPLPVPRPAAIGGWPCDPLSALSWCAFPFAAEQSRQMRHSGLILKCRLPVATCAYPNGVARSERVLGLCRYDSSLFLGAAAHWCSQCPVALTSGHGAMQQVRCVHLPCPSLCRTDLAVFTAFLDSLRAGRRAPARSLPPWLACRPIGEIYEILRRHSARFLRAHACALVVGICTKYLCSLNIGSRSQF